MTVHYDAHGVTLHHGDCLDVLAEMPDNSVDAVVTDPPAGISFMGRAWDGDKGGREQWSAWLAEVMREALRVTKPGGHALVWALPRTSHWTACGLEDAGWQIRDRVVHLFGTGFPKSLDVGRAIDKAGGVSPAISARVLRDARVRARMTRAELAELVGCTLKSVTDWEDGRIRSLSDPAPEFLIPSPDYRRKLADALGYTADERIAVGVDPRPIGYGGANGGGTSYGDAATPAAQQWQGWGTALKPAAEDWWLARKPLIGNVAANVLEWGTGALNIDGCRTEGRERTSYGLGNATRTQGSTYGAPSPGADFDASKGRWPANVILDGSQADALDEQSGISRDGVAVNRNRGEERPMTVDGAPRRVLHEDQGYGGKGGASRFFPVFRYEPKADTTERPHANGVAHPTVKPLDLMRWLVRLVTPPGGTVLDMFAGSGTTGEACVLEGFNCILIEREPDYLPLITNRLNRRLNPVAYVAANRADDDKPDLLDLLGEATA